MKSKKILLDCRYFGLQVGFLLFMSRAEFVELIDICGPPCPGSLALRLGLHSMTPSDSVHCLWSFWQGEGGG